MITIGIKQEDQSFKAIDFDLDDKDFEIGYLILEKYNSSLLANNIFREYTFEGKKATPSKNWQKQLISNTLKSIEDNNYYEKFKDDSLESMFIYTLKSSENTNYFYDLNQSKWFFNHQHFVSILGFTNYKLELKEEYLDIAKKTVNQDYENLSSSRYGRLLLASKYIGDKL